ncbi:MAG: cation:proton antiporter domain-containing protein [Candidatus Helarchaeota archaeon]
MFAALIFGMILAFYNPFTTITSSPTFSFLSQLGMYLLLFMIGFEMDLNKFKKRSKFIVKSSLFIIIFEAIFGTLIVYFLFHVNLIIAIIIGLSFATVGEEILIPILDESKITNKPLGQTIIGIGTIDDIFEILSLILVIFLVGPGTQGDFNLIYIFISLAALFIITIAFLKLRKEGRKFSIMKIETMFIFVMFILFLFIGIGLFAEAASLSALLAGISAKNFIPKERLI